MAQVLIDTNIVVYAHDTNEGAKYSRALEVIDRLREQRRGCLSAQVLAEFMNATTKTRRPILSVDEALAQVRWLAEGFPIFDLTKGVVFEAIRCVRDYQISYFDAQLWATAKENRVGTILSEDFQHGRVVEGVRFVNPLLDGVTF